ncbi:HTH-type transcriptional regulator DmlR [compost metagenome]
MRLLNRTTRQVNVTADGAACYERVVRLLAGIDDADTSLSGAAALPRGRLRIDVPAPLARLLLVPALPAFLARYPDIQLDLGVSDRTVDLIGENVDAVLRGGPIRDPSLVARRIGDLQAGLYATLIAALVPAAPAFAQEPAATPTPDPLLTALLDCHFGYAQQHVRSSASATGIATAAGSHCETVLQAAGLETYLRALAAGLPAESAEQSRLRMLLELRQMLPGFTVDKVIQFRAEDHAR